MKYVIFIIGLILIALRTFGLQIDIMSIGLFVIISIIASLKNLNSISEFSGFGIKLKFNKEVKELNSKAEKIVNEIYTEDKQDKSLNGKEQEKLPLQGDPLDHHEEASNYFDVFTYKPDLSNPKTALIEVAIEIERKLKTVSRGVLGKENKYPISPKRIINELNERKIIDSDTIFVFDKFWNLRNQVVHGIDTEYTNSQILSLVDSGMKIITILNSIDNRTEKRKLHLFFG